MKTALITGGGSGIGQALAWQFAKQGLRVFIVGRRLEKLQCTVERFPENIIPIQADIGTHEGRLLITAALKQVMLDYLVHNAAVAEPVAMLPDLKLEDFRNAMAINLEAPVFLTQALLSQLQTGCRILNISSGLAHRALKGTSTYCISKAGLHMAYLAFNVELNSRGIYAGSVMPGVVDTEMQAHLRAQDASKLPDVTMFKDFKAQGTLHSSESVASLLARFLENTSNDIFVMKDWRIEELSTLFAHDSSK